MQNKREIQALTLALVASYTALGLILYFGRVPNLRLAFGLLMVVPMILSGARLGVAEHALKYLNPNRYPRRFLRLRSHVEDLLAEIRRLNGVALDARRGVRAQNEANELMDAIEGRLVQLIAEIRASAGKEDPEAIAIAKLAAGVPTERVLSEVA